MKSFNNIFKLITLGNLFLCWDKFKKGGKLKKKDVQLFELNLEDNIVQLYEDIRDKKYKHLPYEKFYIYDPKFRIINKASVRDRILHHLIFRILYAAYNPIFIFHSYSSRIGKSTHKGIEDLYKALGEVSKNHSQKCYILKCDIRKFYASIDHQVLLDILGKRIKDEDFLWLLKEVIGSFTSELSPNIMDCFKGVPIGNLTSQILANVYLNEFDQFVKHKLKVKHYLRYADDFVIIHKDEEYLNDLVEPIKEFLGKKLKLELHAGKASIKKYRRGVDFLGYILFSHHSLIRTKTKQRMLKNIRDKIQCFNNGRIEKESLNQTIQSYLGILPHCDSHKLKQDLLNKV
uniref:Reverse transcriptase domain-containing protein n=1 Tax=candidate division CPR3 bacterium TaxID=2268181 RepID=A0A7C4M5G6_UNCC3